MSWNNYVLRSPTLVTDFSTTTGMTLTQGTGSVALDATSDYVRTGTKSLKIVQLASASSALVDLDMRNTAFGGTGSEGPSAVADNLWHLRSFVDNPANQNNLSFFVSNTAGGFTDYFTQNVMGAALSAVPNRWWDRVESRKDWSVAAGTPSWTTPVRTIRIRPGANANGTLTTWLDALYRGGYARPKVVITFDDSSGGQYLLAKPVLDTYGLKATFYVLGAKVSADVGDGLTQAQVNTLYDQKHDIGYHAWTDTDHTNYGTLTTAELMASHNAWLAYAQFRYPRSYRHHAMPLGSDSATIRASVSAAGFLTGRGTQRLIQNHLFGIDDPLNLRCYSVDFASDTVNSLIEASQTAITYGSTLFLNFHAVHATTTSGAQISVADFTTLMADLYRKQQSNLLDVVTVSQWYSGLTSPWYRSV